MSRKVEVQIVGNSESLHRALGSATSGTTRLGSAFGHVARIAGGLGLALGGLEVLKFGKDAILAAAQTQKANESIRQNFGKSGKAVVDFNEHAAAGFGISAQSAAQFATQIGLMTTNIGLSKTQGAQMTIGLEKLSGAVALIKGQDPAASFGKLNKALLGNTRGLKDMGIAITPLGEKLQAMRDGFIGPKGTISTLTAAQRAQVIYGLAVKHLPTLLDQAKKHSGDFADQIIVLKARLSNLAEEIGAKALPVIQKLASTISDVAAAPSFTVGVKVLFHGIEAGAKSIAEGIQHALLGSTKNVEIKAPSGLGIGNQQTISKGIVQKIAEGLKSTNWSGVGKEVGRGISSSIKFTAAAAGKIVSSLVGAINSNRGAIAAAGVGIIAEMFVTILDPSFWIKNWRLALDVAVAALSVAFAPAKLLEPLRALPFADFLIKPLEALGKPMRAVVERLARGIVSGLRDVFPEVAKASEEIGTKAIGGIRSLPKRALNIVEDMGRFIGRELGNAARQAGSGALHIGQRIVGALDNFIADVGGVANRIATRFLGPIENLAGRVIGPVRSVGRTIVRAVGGFIRSVASTGFKIGAAIIQGVINGAESLFGSLVSKLEGILSGALGKAKSFLHIGSPSKVFAEEVGRPIAEGIAMGIDQHGHKIGASLVGAVGAARGGATAAGGGGGRGVMQVNLILDRRTLASVLVDMDKDYRRQNSGRPLLSGR